MKTLVAAVLALGIAALVDRQVSEFRYTNAATNIAIGIKRSFLGR